MCYREPLCNARKTHWLSYEKLEVLAGGEFASARITGSVDSVFRPDLVPRIKGHHVRSEVSSVYCF